MLAEADDLQLALGRHLADEGGDLGGADVERKEVVGIGFAAHGVTPGAGVTVRASVLGSAMVSLAGVPAAGSRQATAKPLA